MIATRLALRVYDAGAPRRDAAFRAILHDEAFLINEASIMDDYRAWEKSVKDALELVVLAYFHDTSHLNKLEDCRLVPLSVIRRMAECDQ